jgi:glutamate-1-semialdehyde 2,1-aminomutase
MTTTPSAASLADRARQVIPGGVNSGNRWGAGLDDIIVAAAKGARFVDGSGRNYVDYHLAGGPILLGHCRADVDKAAARTADRIDLVGVARTELEVRLAEAMVQLVPAAEQVLLTNSGSEATYHAIRLARAATGRRLLVKFEGCYHGWHDSVALSLTPTELQLGKPDPLSAGAIREVLDLTLVLPFNDVGAVAEAFAMHGDDIAAVIVEPIAHNVGALLPVDGFLEALRRHCNRHGSILIFDEVITGFRHDIGGFQRLCGVIPDVATFGKALANGYPIGALAGKQALMELFSTRPQGSVFFAGTFNGHPGAVAAALRVLDVLSHEPVHDHLFRLGDLVRAGLREMWTDAAIPAVVTGFGSVFVTYFMDGVATSYSDLLRNDARLFCGYRRQLLDDGIFEFPRNLKRNHLSFAHTESDAEQLIVKTKKAAQRALARTNESCLA